MPIQHPITARQTEVLAYLRRFTEEHGEAPTLREIADTFGITAPAANQILAALEKKGYILRMPGVPRGITLLYDETSSENVERAATAAELFLGVYCVRDRNSGTAADGIYAAYRNWCRQQKKPTIAEPAFKTILTRAGFSYGRDAAGAFVYCVRLTD